MRRLVVVPLLVGALVMPGLLGGVAHAYDVEDGGDCRAASASGPHANVVPGSSPTRASVCLAVNGIIIFYIGGNSQAGGTPGTPCGAIIVASTAKNQSPSTTVGNEDWHEEGSNADCV